MKMNSDKFKIFLGLVGSGLALLGVFFFFAMSESMGEAVGISDTIMISLVIIMVILAAYLFSTRMKDVQKGLPAEDEMSKKISHKAGAYAYYASVLTAVALFWYNTFFVDNFGFPKLSFTEAMAVIALFPGVIFMLLALYFNKRGDV